MNEDADDLPSEEEGSKGGGLKIEVPSESSETATSTSSEDIFAGRGKRKKKAKKRKKKKKLSPIAAAASNARSLKNDSKSNSPASKEKGEKRARVVGKPTAESVRRKERRMGAASEKKEQAKKSDKAQRQKKRASMGEEEKEELQELDTAARQRVRASMGKEEKEEEQEANTAARQRVRASMGDEEKEELQELDTAARQRVRESMGKGKKEEEKEAHLVGDRKRRGAMDKGKNQVVQKANTSNRAIARKQLSKSEREAIREADTLAREQQREALLRDKAGNKQNSSPSIVPDNFSDMDQDPNIAQWLFNSRGPLGGFSDLYDVAVTRAMNQPATQDQIDAAVASTIPLIDKISDQIHEGRNDRIEFANSHGSIRKNGLPSEFYSCACCGRRGVRGIDIIFYKRKLEDSKKLQYSIEIPSDVAKHARAMKASKFRDPVSDIPFDQILSSFEFIDENNEPGTVGSLWHLHREFVDYDELLGAYWFWACADCHSALETKPHAERPKFGVANVDFGGFFRINIYDISAVEFMAISLHITFMLLIKMSAPGKSTSGNVLPVIQGQTVTFSTSASLDTAEMVSAAIAAEANAGNRFPNRTLHDHLQLTWVGTTGQLKKHLSKEKVFDYNNKRGYTLRSN